MVVTSYATCIPCFFFWGATFVKMLLKKPNTNVLAIICVLMMVFQVAWMISIQLFPSDDSGTAPDWL